MGLDQYLKKRIYIGAEYEHRKVTGEIDIKIDGQTVNINFDKVSYIVESVAYWRKANQIHNWFVDNIQDGNDNCKEYYINKDQLEDLLAKCKIIQLDPAKAPDVLPVREGFFFGDTEYNEYYMDDINYTVGILTEILKDFDFNADYYYSSSW